MLEHWPPPMRYLLLLSLLVATAHYACCLPPSPAEDQARGLSPARALVIAQQHPANVTGHYKGSWRKEAMDAALEDTGWLERDGGVAIFQLSTSDTSVPGVHNVAGELLLRDGVYLTEEPTALTLDGVYVAATGQLHARASPAGGQLRLPLNESEAQDLPEYRQALRDKARLWTTPGRQPPLFFFMREDTMAYINRMEKECEFALDLSVHLAARQQDQGEAQLGEVALGAPGRRQRRLAEDSLLGAVGDAALAGQAGTEGVVEGPEEDRGDLVLNGTLVSANCGLALALEGSSSHLAQHYAKAIRYTACMTALALLQILLMMRQMDAAGTQALASKVSLVSLGQQAIMDAHLCLLHLTTGIVVEPLFTAFATAAFFEFALFAVFELRYLLHAWRARRAGALDPWSAQRELSWLYAQFYGWLLGGIFLTYQLQRWMKGLVFLLLGFWVPQIVHCARHDARQPLRPLYVVGTSLTRLALPLYLYGCPRNVLKIGHSPGVCLGLCASMAVQVALLLSQRRWGPRWFVPKAFLPAKYDYHRRAPARPPEQGAAAGEGNAADAEPAGDIETGDAGTECVICMNPLDVEALAARMVTPCGHFFHPACLARWMDVKMECPTCRTPLPPL